MNDLAAAAHDKLQHGFNPESRDRDSAELLFYALRLSAYLLSEDTRERTRADAEHVKLVRAMRQYLKEHDAERNPP